MSSGLISPVEATEGGNGGGTYAYEDGKQAKPVRYVAFAYAACIAHKQSLLLLMAEILIPGNPGFKSKSGGYGGSFATEEMVYELQSRTDIPVLVIKNGGSCSIVEPGITGFRRLVQLLYESF